MMRRLALVGASLAILAGSLAFLAPSASAAQVSSPDPNGSYVICKVAYVGSTADEDEGVNAHCVYDPTYFGARTHVTVFTLEVARPFNPGYAYVLNFAGFGGMPTDMNTSTKAFNATYFTGSYGQSEPEANLVSSISANNSGQTAPSGNQIMRACNPSNSSDCVWASITTEQNTIQHITTAGTSYPADPGIPPDYFAGGVAPPPPPPPPDCAVTNVAANWPSTGPAMSTQYQLAITYTGTATQLSIIFGDKRAPTVMNPAPASVATVAVYWDQVGSYSAEVDCTGTSGAVSKWAIPVNVVQASKSLTACLPDSIGSVLDPTAWVKSMGCVMEWAFVPSDQTKAQFAAVWGNVQTKAPFSFVYDVATFLPNSANQFASGIHDADAPNVIGDRSCATFIEPAPLSGTPGIGSGPRVDGCIDSQLSNNGLSPWAATVRSIILFLVLITLALGIWRMTTKAIG